MEFPAISKSHLLNFDPNPKPLPLTFHSQTNFRFKSTDHVIKNRFYIFSESKNEYTTTNISSLFKNKKTWIHFVGVGGCGMSALAMLALKQGFEVSGSDIVWNEYMDRLREAGARLFVGHSVLNIERKGFGSCLPDKVVVSSAIGSDNVEVLHAKAMGVHVLKRGNWLGMITEHHNLVAVSGTHGKTTTASMLAYVLSAMGVDLTAVVGAQVPQFPGGNILCCRSPNFILEADEYDGCFLQLSPYIAVVTNVEWEHADIFQDEEAVKNSFKRFLKQIKVGGHLILCRDSEGAYSLVSETCIGTAPVLSKCSSQPLDAGYRVTTYGTSSLNEWCASSICPNSQGGTDYVLCHMGSPVADISLQLTGVHNVLNSLAVIAAVRALINDYWPTQRLIDCIRLHLHNFIGVSRRFEMIGIFNKCHIYDDYAHHPTEVRAVIQAARQRFPLKALWVIFQPHTFSRLAAFLKDFATALGDADRVVITKVYDARETGLSNVSGRDLAVSVVGPLSEYIPSVVCQIIFSIFFISP
ncbi:hypothetical protein IFM89_023722 [Coptis chinensis]|uniref:UDP-N-acetylmuramate--L-alanine ligase n=1 Tax=Coptis chinensis TaxID=261450 RepID=A0A835IE43_9MAGN|nr:hypothetical protein IFM89_023722 [Coptis chinensis]